MNDFKNRMNKFKNERINFFLIIIGIIFFFIGYFISFFCCINRDYDYDLFETETYKNIDKVEYNKGDKEFKIYKEDGNIIIIKE